MVSPSAMDLQEASDCTKPIQSYVPSAYHDRGSMFQKGRIQSVYAPRASIAAYRPGVDSNEMNDTEFEEDLSDFEEYSGRRSEDSVRNHRRGESSVLNLTIRRLARPATPRSLPTMSSELPTPKPLASRDSISNWKTVCLK